MPEQVASLLDSIPGVSAIMNRWLASPTDAGLLFVDSAFVVLDGYEIKLPVTISISARRRVRVKSNEGLLDTIKFMTPSVSIDITLAGMAGNWRKTTMPSLPTVPGIGGAMGGLAGIATTLLGTDAHIDKIKMLAELFGKLKKADKPITITDVEGLLSGQGIRKAVPLSFNETTVDEQVAWTMRLVSDRGDNPLTLIFPEEEKEQAE